MAPMAQTGEISEAPFAPPDHADDRASRRRSASRRFERAPSVVITAVILILIASATVRLYELQRPNVLVFDETYYARDAHTILHGYLGPMPLYPWEPGKEVSWPHPEYGKFAIAVGEAAFGNTSYGWRIVPAIAGTILLALVYPIGRRLGLAPVWALLGLLLAASDFLGIVQSRIATLDIFVALWSVLCVYLALRYVQTGHRLRWLFLCGLAGGLAFGTKWSGAFAVAAAMAVMLLYRRRSWRRPAATAVVQALRDVVLPAVALVVLPVALYCASYVVYFAKGRHTLSQWWALQHEMWWFNENLHATHTYASHAYTWIIDYRPVWYYYQTFNGAVHGIISIGNPLLWWASVPALVALVALAFVRRDRELVLVPLIVALLYLPWLNTTRTSFMYYMTPVAPFLALAVATILRELSHARLPRLRWAVLCYAAAAAVVALLWYQIGELAAWWFWRLPLQVSPDFARVVLAVALGVLAFVLLALFAWPRARDLWPYLTWVFAGAVTGVCLAFLPILIDLSISPAHFYHLMWFRNWI
jgi:dolichyl-phosphate-mannose--protein O-mannosyl transferase